MQAGQCAVCSVQCTVCRQDSDGEESESALRALPFGGGLVGGLGMGKKGGWEGSVSVTR